ncbi:hypothetical protein AX16_007453 [Volvariella volvacea WC 439]|nr:hypothetical protein AX16_007453 [Volvariella volvacea WC 439]
MPKRRRQSRRSGDQTELPPCLINALPNELLSRIFVYASCNTPLTEWAPSLTHVCRLWRHIALALPRLWTTITFENFDNFEHWVELLISRSSDQLLTLDFQVEWPMEWCDQEDCIARYNEALERISTEMHRTERILLELDNNSLHNIVEYCSSIDAPELKELALSVTKYRGHDDSDVAETVLFSAVYPKLTTLSLSGCRLNSALWKPMLRNLRKLSITKSNTKIELNDPFLQSIARIPHLEYLELGDLFYDISRARRGNPPVSLQHVKLDFPRLKELHISSYAVSLNAFLGVISSPRLRGLSLNYQHRKTDALDTYLSNLPPFLQAFTSSPTSRPDARHLDLFIDHEPQTTVQITGRPFDPSFLCDNNDPIFSLTFSFKKITWKFVGETLDLLPLSDVESLCTYASQLSMSTITPWSRPDLTLLSRLPRLHTVHIRNNTLILSQFTTKSIAPISKGPSDVTKDAIQATQPPSIPFAALSTLVVQDVKFDGKIRNLTPLQNFLNDRMHAGKAIATLHIVDCEGLEDEKIEDLRGMIASNDGGFAGKGLMVL